MLCPVWMGTAVSTSTIPFYSLDFLVLLLYQVAEAEEETAGGLLLTQAAKEKPSVGTVSVLVLLDHATFTVVYSIIC